MFLRRCKRDFAEGTCRYQAEKSRLLASVFMIWRLWTIFSHLVVIRSASSLRHICPFAHAHQSLQASASKSVCMLSHHITSEDSALPPDQSFAHQAYTSDCSCPSLIVETSHIRLFTPVRLRTSPASTVLLKHTPPSTHLPQFTTPHFKFHLQIRLHTMSTRSSIQAIESLIPRYPTHFLDIEAVKSYIASVCAFSLADPANNKLAFLVAVRAFEGGEFYLDKGLLDRGALRGTYLHFAILASMAVWNMC
jgi:hypothetical protein